MKILIDLLIIYLIFNNFIGFSGKYKKLSFIINIIIFTIVSGMTYEVVGGGGDYDNYRYFFQLLNPTELPSKEIGFYYLNLLLGIFTDNFVVVFIIFMFIVNFFILRTIYKYSNNIEISLIIYVILGGYITATNIVRQFIALSLFVYSIKFILSKKYIKYIFFCIVAFQFHTSVLIPMIITILIKIFNEKINKHFFVYVIFVNSFIIIEPIIRKIGIGLFYNQYESGTFNYGSSILHYVVQLIFISVYIINIKNIKLYNNKFFVNMGTLASAFTLLSNNMVLYARIATYFNIFNVIALVNVIYENKNIKEKRVLWYFLCLVLVIYYFALTRSTILNKNYIIDYLNLLMGN